MPRESQITIYRSTSSQYAGGLTFGELGFSDVQGQLYIGRNDGTSLWIGAGVTDASISVNSQYLVPTQSAVKTYVDGIVTAGSGIVNTVNGTGGAITITGDGASQNVVVSGTTTAFTNRLATTSVTGVASFASNDFVVTNGTVTVKNPGVTGITTGTSAVAVTGNNGIYLSGTTGNIQIINTGVRSLTVQGYGSVTDARWWQTGPQIRGDGFNINVVASYDNPLTFTTPFVQISSSGLYSINGITSGSSPNGPFFTITGDGGAIRPVNDPNNAAVNLAARIATTGVTGVAAFNSTYYSVDANGNVTPTSGFQVTGDSLAQGGPALILNRVGRGISADVRIATSGVTGVAAFSSTNFSVTPGGVVSLTTPYTITGDTVSLSGPALLLYRTGNMVNLDARVATTGVTGVAAFSSTQFSVTPGGVVSLTTPYTITGDTINASGPSQLVFRTGNMVNIDNRVATTGVTGVAAFSSTNFSVTPGGVVSLTTAYSTTGDTVSLSGPALLLSRTGNMVNLDARVATTGVTGVAAFSSTNFSVTPGGVVSLTTAYSTTGDTVSLSGPALLLSRTGNMVNLDARVATTGVTGVAAFSSTNFSVTPGGVVSLTTAYSTTGDTINASGPSQLVFRTGNMVNLDNRVATTGVTGVAAFSSTNFSVTPGGVVSLTTPYTITGDTISASGPAQLVFRTGNMVNLDVRVATTGVTGVAAFNTNDFTVSTAGSVSLGNTVARTNAANTFSQPQTFSAGLSSNGRGDFSAGLSASGFVVFGNGFTANSRADFPAGLSASGITAQSISTLSINTSSLAVSSNATIQGDLTVNGNAYVNGDVVTINVGSFTVEDAFIGLGTGNAADSTNIGIYGQYYNSTGTFSASAYTLPGTGEFPGVTAYSGVFRDYSDSGKWKFFRGVTANPGSTNTISTAPANGFKYGTIVARIDCGTF